MTTPNTSTRIKGKPDLPHVSLEDLKGMPNRDLGKFAIQRILQDIKKPKRKRMEFIKLMRENRSVVVGFVTREMNELSMTTRVKDGEPKAISDFRETSEGVVNAVFRILEKQYGTK